MKKYRYSCIKVLTVSKNLQCFRAREDLSELNEIVVMVICSRLKFRFPGKSYSARDQLEKYYYWDFKLQWVSGNWCDRKLTYISFVQPHYDPLFKVYFLFAAHYSPALIFSFSILILTACIFIIQIFAAFEEWHLFLQRSRLYGWSIRVLFQDITVCDRWV